MELTRKQVIDNLEKFVELRLLTSGFCETELFESLIYAISSLKTDLKYDLMYEGVKVYTEDEVIAMITEIQLEIEESENCGKAFHLGLQMASNIIQQKITSLQEDTP